MAALQLKNVTVIGGGNLGSQIAWHSAFKGKTVVLCDSSETSLESCKTRHDGFGQIYLQDCGASNDDLEATRGRIRYTDNLADAVSDADFVIEAVPEVPDVKSELYSRMSSLLPERTLVATNTSSLRPSEFADTTGRPAKFCALHFANLIWSLNMVELMAHPATHIETLEAVAEFAIEIGMVPLPIRKESPGYMTNSWMPALLASAIRLVADGVATAEDVDRSYLIVNRGCKLGPCGIADIAGIETMSNVFASIAREAGDSSLNGTIAFLKDMLDRKLLGVASGKGFYEYPDPAFAAPGFLDVPTASQAKVIAKKAFLSGR